MPRTTKKATLLAVENERLERDLQWRRGELEAAVYYIVAEDDGVGGGDASGGSGLRGLSDRVSALDGALRVDSRRGGPTILRATIPL
jgi:glucose-6-phosphate-specific signal transduction histidine kinase